MALLTADETPAPVNPIAGAPNAPKMNT